MSNAARRPTILRRILFPITVMLLLLPLLSCLIFQAAAAHYAKSLASQELRALQQEVLPLIEQCFGTQNGTDRQEQRRSKQAELEQSKDFLARVKPLLKERSGSADMLILNYRFEPVYPRDVEDLSAIEPLTTACIAQITTHSGAPLTGVRQITAENQETAYLVEFFEVGGNAKLRAKYLLTYSPILGIGDWIEGATTMVLGISGFFALLTLGALWTTARSISSPLHRLCLEAERIGDGDFGEIDRPFPLREPEELRLAMNRMSHRLRRADEVQRDFFQNISHELRTPLMSIGGYAQGIECGVFPQPQEAAKTILSESARLSALVNSLLTLSRLEGSQRATSVDTMRLLAPIADCLDRISGTALERKIALILQPFDEGLCVQGEEELFCKVLENLLSNAIRYARGTAIVSVEQRGSRVSVSVSDDGRGLSDQDRLHLFERCYKGEGGNFGIGLAIARSAASAMGAELTGENSPTSGAVFALSLIASPPK